MGFRRVNPKEETERAVKNDPELRGLVDKEREKLTESTFKRAGKRDDDINRQIYNKNL